MTTSNDGVLIIARDGTVRCISSSVASQVTARLGVMLKITRASHVEPLMLLSLRLQLLAATAPDFTGDPFSWYADMSPVSGLLLGPFDCRSAASKAEIAWLVKHNMPPEAKLPQDPSSYRPVHCAR